MCGRHQLEFGARVSSRPRLSSSDKIFSTPGFGLEKTVMLCENRGALKETVPAVANGGIRDTTGTVPFARKALHSTPFAVIAGLNLC
jgi:hypothetical protein